MAEDLLKTISRLHSEGVGGKTNKFTATPTVTAGAYTAGDAVGGQIVFKEALNDKSFSGIIQDLIIIDDAGQDVDLELWIFNRTFTAIADNAAGAFSEADLENLVGVISTADGAWYESGTPSAATVRNLGLVVKGLGRDLFCQLVTRGTPTFAATDDVTVKIGILQD
jgi:hypothetical protein